LSFKTVDVAIGIAFLYLLLTFVASAIVELISSVCNWRALMLHDAIGNMLKRSNLLSVNDIYENPLVLALGRNNAARSWIDLFESFGWHQAKGKTAPSYMPAATFSAAALDVLINKAGASFELSPDGAVGLLRALLSSQPQSPQGETVHQKDAFQSVLRTTLATQGSSIQAVRFAIEKWFNETMDRTSGWYKRRTQSCLLLIGLMIAFGTNVNTIGVARWLWQGDAARQAVITSATQYIQSSPPLQKSAGGVDAQPPSEDLAKLTEQIVNLDRRVSALQYPMGWPPPTPDWHWFLEYLLGAIITAIAISMGSTFWFDALQSLIKIRGTGPKPAAR
jgi:hypothetical protein